MAQKRVTIKVPNWREIDDQLEKEIQDEINKTALRIETEAKKNTPVDTGRLRSSIKIDLRPLEAEIGTNVNYAAFVEFGTSKQSAQPYLFPAFERERKRYINNIKALVNNFE